MARLAVSADIIPNSAVGLFFQKNRRNKDIVLYYSMVHSNIAYGINIYGCANTTNLEKNLKKAKTSHTHHQQCPSEAEPIRPHCLKNSKYCLWDNLEYSRIEFMHRFHFKKLPPSFSEMWKTNRERNPDRILRNADDLYVPPIMLNL
jgi:hypothetical protein